MSGQGFTFLDPPSREDEISRVLTILAADDCEPETLEANAIDLKEEAGRRDRSGILPGHPHSEAVARQLAEEATCMANTRGGGALIVGVDDKTGELKEQPQCEVLGASADQHDGMADRHIAASDIG